MPFDDQVLPVQDANDQPTPIGDVVNDNTGRLQVVAARNSVKLCLAFGEWLQVLPLAQLSGLDDTASLQDSMLHFERTPMIGRRWNDFVG